MPAPPATNDDSFLDDMEQRLQVLKTKSSSNSNPTPPPSLSPPTSNPTSPTPPPPSFVKRATLPREPFFVQLRGFSLIGDVAYFTMIDEGWWSLYAFVMMHIKREFHAGRLPQLKESDIITSKHVVVCDWNKAGHLRRGVIMGFDDRDEDGGVLVDVRDVDEALDMKVPVVWLFEMPEEGLSVPFRALKVQIDKTQLLVGSDIVCRAFNEAQFSTNEVFKAIQVKDRCASIKKDTFTLEMYTPLKENLGDILIRNLPAVCSVPVPQPNLSIPVTISHFTESGEIYYQACMHQRKLLSIIQDFDVLIRQELPSIKKLNPDYSNVLDVKKRIDEPGHVFAAPYSEDGKYYRAELAAYDEQDKNMVHVHFIDYGNDDHVKISELLLLDLFDEALTHIPRMCRRANLANIKYLDTERMDDVLLNYADLKIKVLETSPKFLAELFVVEGKNSDGKEILKRVQEVLGDGNWN